METFEHNGATYVKVSVLAKRFNYTTDYIGQLCRQGKVEAKLVGRSWFVREASLLEHGSDRLKISRPHEILSKINPNDNFDSVANSSKVSVFPQLSKHSHRTILSASHSIPVHSEPNERHFPFGNTIYNEDTSASIPDFNFLKPITLEQNVPEANTPQVEPGHKISIHTETKTAKKLYFSSLPEVSLQGDLSVRSLDAEDEYEESTPVTVNDVVIQPKPAPVRMPLPHPAVLSQPKSGIPQPKTQARTQSEIPKSLPPSRTRISIFIPLVFVLSLSVAATLLSLSARVESDGSVLNQSLHFNLAQVSESLSFLR